MHAQVFLTMCYNPILHLIQIPKENLYEKNLELTPCTDIRISRKMLSSGELYEQVPNQMYF